MNETEFRLVIATRGERDSDKERERKRERLVSYDDLALEAWTQRERERERVKCSSFKK